MHLQHSERGTATPIVLAIILLVAIGGVYWYQSRSTSDAMPEATVSSSPSPIPSESGVIQKASVQEYSQAAYDAAVATGPVVLYYYANWCPICAVEYPQFQSAAGTFDASVATFFRVNFNDSETTDDEEASAREHQVGYQHTVVIVKGGQQVYKSQSTGNYADRIGQYLP